MVVSVIILWTFFRLKQLGSYLKSIVNLIVYIIKSSLNLTHKQIGKKHYRSRALPLDVSVVGWVSKKLREIAPEEWEANQDWIAELMEARQHLLKRYPRKVVAFITIWRLVPFAWHVLNLSRICE
jgi:uncharacterized protein with HEPN domain